MSYGTPMIERRTGLVYVIALLAAWPSASAAQEVVTLQTLEAQAISDNPSLEAREARVRAAAARIEAIDADMRPRLTFDVGAQASPGAVQRQRCGEDRDPADGVPDDVCYVRGQAVGGEGAETFLPAVVPSASLRYEGVLYDFGRTRARRRAGRAEMEALEVELEAAEDAIVRMVRGSYLNWLAAHMRRLATERALAVAEQRVQSLGAAIATGARSEADRDSAVIEVTRTQLELARARSAEGVSRRLLARVAGVTIADGALPDVSLVELPTPVAAAQDTAAVRVLELRRDVALAGRRAYDLRHAPILSMSLQTGIGAQFAANVPVLVSPSYQVQIGLTVPLWDPRSQSFVVDEAIAQAESLEAAAREQALTTSHAEAESRQRLTDVEAEIRLAEQVVEGTRRAAAGAEERFRIAGGGIDPVLNAQARARSAEDELMRARLERLDAVLRLMPVR